MEIDLLSCRGLNDSCDALHDARRCRCNYSGWRRSKPGFICDDACAVSGMNAGQIESALEIDAGKGAFSRSANIYIEPSDSW